MITYVDTSAAAKLLLAEAESGAVRAFVESVDPERDALVASRLMRTELSRLAFREGIGAEPVARVLDHVALVDLTRAMLDAAGAVRHPVRTLGALHLATAAAAGGPSLVRILTYDSTMAAVAQAEGFAVVSPR